MLHDHLVYCQSPFPCGHRDLCCTGILDRLDILVILDILDISGLTFPLPAPPSLLFPCHHDLKDKLSQSHLHCSASAVLRREISLCTCWISPCWFPSRTGTLWRNRQLSLGMFLFLTLTLLPVLTQAASLHLFLPLCSHTFPFSIFPALSNLPWHSSPSWKGSRSLILHFLLPLILLFSSCVKNTGRKEG